MALDNQPDLQVEGWLKTLGIESLFQWDVLVFLYRHQPSLASTGDIAGLLAYPTGPVSAALDSLTSSELVECSRASQGVRLYQLTAPADPTRRDALERIMTLADSNTVRLPLARKLRGSDQPNQNKNGLRSPGAEGSKT